MKNLSQHQISKALRILYPFWMIIGMFGLMYVPSVLFVDGNTIETAQNIKSNEMLFRLGIVARLITQLFVIIIPILLYMLFESYNRFLAVFMLVFNLVSVPIAMYAEVHSLQALVLLDNPDQMMQHIDMNWFSINIASIFWGLWLFPLGLLAMNSGYFPKIIGYCLLIGGVGYLLGSFFQILLPEANSFYSFTEILTIGEVIFIIWLIIKGPKLERTTEIT